MRGMSGARLLVVEHQKNAGLGQLSARLLDSGMEIETVGPDTGKPLPASLAGFDGLVVLGGTTGPTEDERAPWLPAARRLLQESVKQQIPALGICLGAQLLATAAGGHVRTMPQGPEIGLHAVRFRREAAEDPLFRGFADRRVHAVQWHWLEADELPATANVLASSAACRNQVFRIGKAAWGVQFHPEALGDTAQVWADEDRGNLVKLGLEEQAIVQEVRAAEKDLRDTWGALAERFAVLVKSAAPHHMDGEELSAVG